MQIIDRMDSAGDRPQVRLLLDSLAVVIPGLAIFGWHALHYGSWLIDDAGISFAYARNLAGGFGLTAQPGVTPVEGFSNPLWTALLALLYWLHLFCVPFVPKLLGTLLVALSFVALTRSVMRLLGRTEAAIVAGCSLMMTAANPGFVIWCVSGLENPLLLFLTSMLLLFTLEATSGPDISGGSKSIQAGLLAAAVALTRPDGIVYALVYPVGLALNAGPFQLRPFLKSTFSYAVALVLPFGSYLIFRRLYFGDWLPNTYYAKPKISAWGLVDLAHMGGIGTFKFTALCNAILPVFPIFFVMVVFSAIFIVITMNNRHANRGTILIGMFVALSFATFLILPPDWMHEYRFATVAFPFTYLLCFLVLQKSLVQTTWIRSKHLILSVCGIGLLVVSVPEFAIRSLVFTDSLPGPLDFEAVQTYRFNRLADELAIRNPSLLTADFGATLLLSNLRLVDMAGLCDRTIGRMYNSRLPPADFARYMLNDVDADFLKLDNDTWKGRVGLLGNEQLNQHYIDLGHGEYVRRASIRADLDETTVRAIAAKISFSPSLGSLHEGMIAPPPVGFFLKR
jgi:hypothetical protein